MAQKGINKFYSPLDASERILSSGRPLAPGEFFDLDQEEQDDEFNKRLIDEGQILPVPDPVKKEDSKKGDE